MARFDSGVFGFLRGKIGTLVARKRYGETYVSRKPGKIKANQTKAAKDNRERFKRIQTLSHEIRRHKELRDFWKAVDADGLNDNTKVIKRNSMLIRHDVLLPGCGITPAGDNVLEVKNVEIHNFRVSFDFKLNRANPKALELPYDVYLLLLFEKIQHHSYPKEFYSALIIHRIEEEPSEEYTRIISKYDDISRQNAEVAVKRHAMIAVIKFNDLKNKYEYSDTNFSEITNFVSEKITLSGNQWKYVNDDGLKK
jgi:hypothetical protein